MINMNQCPGLVGPKVGPRWRRADRQMFAAIVAWVLYE